MWSSWVFVYSIVYSIKHSIYELGNPHGGQPGCLGICDTHHRSSAATLGSLQVQISRVSGEVQPTAFLNPRLQKCAAGVLDETIPKHSVCLHKPHGFGFESMGTIKIKALPKKHISTW